MHRATVYVCPKCDSLVNVDELYKLLEKIEKKLIEKI